VVAEDAEDRVDVPVAIGVVADVRLIVS